MSLRRGIVAGSLFILLLSAPALAQDAAPAPVEVRAVEYAFEGLPESVAAGTSFGLVNAGMEDHEFLVMRRAEGTTESVQDLMALPMEEVFAKVELTGGIAARVGQTSGATLTILAPGEYIALCFVPQGTAAGASPAPAAAASSPGASPMAAAPGPPHAALGMVAEFTVTP